MKDKNEIAQLKVENMFLKSQNENIQKHLEDAREEHLLEEVTQLNERIPQRSKQMEYLCQVERDAVLKCYEENPDNVLKCSDFVSQLMYCSGLSTKVRKDN